MQAKPKNLCLFGFVFLFLKRVTNLKIGKILNNNVVVTLNDNRRETIVMGRGIAFKRKIGDELDPSQIDKTFTLSDKSVSSKFQELLADIPMEQVLLAERIINYAKFKLGKEFNDIIYVTLSDHISGAIQRYKEGCYLKNPLLWDVKRFYKDEFEVGQKANQMMEEETGIRFLEDEATFIALHFVNAELNGEISDTYNITRIMQEISDIVRHYFLIEFDENSLYYYRFITHLKFFAQRLLNNIHYDDDNEDLLEVIKFKHKKAFQCVQKIKFFVFEKYKYELGNEEMLYLTMHIARMVKKL
jgi:beta-glucoside operon transcriptional antiterminator